MKLDIKGYKNRTIEFKDSFLLLPPSLRKLCETYGVVNSKGIFPYLLNDLNYNGAFPDFKYFTNIKYEEYLSLKNQFEEGLYPLNEGIDNNNEWNFKYESIKYCSLDCLSLHEVVTKFNQLIYNNWNINIHKVLTLPSLSNKIFKIHYMPKNSIYQQHGTVEILIRNSYTGGAVDVYIPHNKLTSNFYTNVDLLNFDNSLTNFLIDNKVENNYETLYYYDVNSLYPFVMANCLMPIGKPVAFKGDIFKINPDAFGFFYCKITSPEFLLHPIIQRKIKTPNGLRTIAGLGSWTDWIFSEEMKNAIKYGYKFEIIKGYEFKASGPAKQGNIFENFIMKMYNLRLKYPKTDSMNYNAKLIMNSLYGKFGMKDEMTKLDILSNTKFKCMHAIAIAMKYKDLMIIFKNQ